MIGLFQMKHKKELNEAIQILKKNEFTGKKLLTDAETFATLMEDGELDKADKLWATLYFTSKNITTGDKDSIASHHAEALEHIVSVLSMIHWNNAILVENCEGDFPVSDVEIESSLILARGLQL